MMTTGKLRRAEWCPWCHHIADLLTHSVSRAFGTYLAISLLPSDVGDLHYPSRGLKSRAANAIPAPPPVVRLTRTPLWPHVIKSWNKIRRRAMQIN